MDAAGAWFMCRVGYVETMRAVGLSAGQAATRAVKREWPAFEVVEVDQALTEHASELAMVHGLRTLDALHLAAALLVVDDDFSIATWDRRLHEAARAEGLTVLPTTTRYTK